MRASDGDLSSFRAALGDGLPEFDSGVISPATQSSLSMVEFLRGVAEATTAPSEDWFEAVRAEFVTRFPQPDPVQSAVVGTLVTMARTPIDEPTPARAATPAQTEATKVAASGHATRAASPLSVSSGSALPAPPARPPLPAPPARPPIPGTPPPTRPSL